jgi:5-methylcytosine-specific restriction endonuclease McrA
MSEIETRLNEFNFSEAAASIYSKCHFRCQYCGFDGLSSVDAYWSLQVDHILPKSKYPDLEKDLKNQILACTVCNTFKDNFNPSCGEKEKYNLSDEHDRNVLVNKSREYIFGKRAEETNLVLKLKELICSNY